MPEPTEAKPPEPSDPVRRSFLVSGVMAGGLIAGYGAFAAIAGRFLFPARPTPSEWMFVLELGSMKPGESLVYRTPIGATVAVARTGSSGTDQDFLALSSTCPHLGCQVHWESQNNRFFCPCHNGTFDPSGKATGGPPAEAGQSLLRYPLKVEKGLLFIRVPVETLSGRGPCKGCPRRA